MKKTLFTILFSAFAYLGFSQTIRKVKMDEVMQMADTSSCPLVINFWATWCPPCVEELPWFEKNIAAYKDKGVKLLLVSLDFGSDYPAGIAKFAKEKGYVSQIVWLYETDANAYCPKVDESWEGSIPVTLMVNNQKGYKQFFNHPLSESQLQSALEQLVNE
jgi:thiol-disulfide isomerase/thioredoxin